MSKAAGGTKRQLVLAILASVFSGLLLSTSGRGPDFGNYLDWARALVSADVFQIRSNVLSPMGVPYTVWSHGSGLLFSLGGLVEGRLVDFELGALVVGWLGALVFWWTMSRILSRASGNDVWLTVFGLGILFLGTHAGFYTQRHATESLSYPLVALLVWYALNPRPVRVVDALLVGTATAFLMPIRLYLLVYALPVVGLTAWRIWHAQEDGRLVRGLLLSLLVMPLALSAVQLAFVNRWMTGSVIVSQYSFGAGNFRSLDWARPELWAVMAHPLHGVLPYHPLYVVGFAALIVLIVWSDSHAVRLACGLAALAFVATLYVQASYFTWWMGIDTFGARGVASAAVVVTPAVVHVIARSQHRNVWSARVWLLLAMIACLWSYLHLVQVAPTAFFTYREVFTAQWYTFRRLLPGLLVLVLAVAVAVILLGLRGRGRDTSTGNLVRRRTDLMVIGAVVSVVLSLAALISRLFYNPEPTLVRGGVAVAVVGSVGSLAWALLRRPSEYGQAGFELRVLGESAIGWSYIAAFITSSVLFANLAVHTERRIGSQEPSHQDYEYVGSVPYHSVSLAYREYRDIPGFEDKKAALLEYLQSLDLVPSFIVPPPNGRRVFLFAEPGTQTAAMRLLDYTVSGDAIAPGATLEVVLTWQSDAPMSTDWTIFLHVVDRDGTLLAQLDTLPGKDLLATSSLLPGSAWQDRFDIVIPETVSTPSEVSLIMGLYDPSTGERMVRDGGQVDYARLADLSVVPPPGLGLSN